MTACISLPSVCILACLVATVGCERNTGSGHSRDAGPAQTDRSRVDSIEEAPSPEPGQVIPDKVVDGVKMVPIEPPHQLESRRKMLFAVPLDAEAEKDRLELWNELAVYKEEDSPDRVYGLTRAQYRLAGEYLDKYRDATPLEKLVFWHLLSVRFAGTTVGLSASPEEHLATEKKIALFHSALGEDSEDIAPREAVDRAMEILKEAARSNGWKEEE